MKPSFALNLTEEGVTLLHRTARGWMDVGGVSFSDPDLPSALDYLRSTALGLSPKGLTTKLVIPNSQILYLKVSAPGPTEKDRRAQIMKALDGRTPYAVNELVYDWSGDGDEVDVAVVAKETLQEAEAFATEHRFNPVSFVARPDSGFAVEPFFGTADAAASVLSKSQKVERDQDIIEIISRERSKPAAEAETVEPKEEPAAEVTPAAEAATEPADDPVKKADEPKAEPEEDTAASGDRSSSDAPEEVIPAATAAATAIASEPAPDLPKSTSEVKADAPPAVTTASPTKSEDEAPMAVDVPFEDDIPPMPKSLSRAGAPPKAEAEDDIPPPLSSAALMAFASRRSGEVPSPTRNVPPVTARKPDRTTEDAAAPTAPLVSAPRTAAPKTPPVERPAAAKPPPKFSYDDPVPAPPRMPGDPPLPTPAAPPKSSKGLKSLGTLVTSPKLPAERIKRPAGAKPAAMNPSEGVQTGVNPDALAQGLGARTRSQRGKPKYLGLILTGVLLLILAVVAAWSSLYLAQNDSVEVPEVVTAGAEAPAASGTETPAVEQPEPVAAALPEEVDVPSIDDEAAADGEVLAEDEPLPVEDVAASVGDDAPPVNTEPAGTEATASVPADEPAATETAAAPAEVPAPAPDTVVETNVSDSAAPAGDEQDEIFLAGMDQPPAAADPLALPTPTASADALPGPQMPPPPFGTVYQFDAEGRIVPTPEGITTPEGVLLIAGQPPIVPPARPDTVTAAAAAAVSAPASPAEAATPTAEIVDTALSPEQTFAADPTLSDARPRSRPASLTPATAPAGSEDDASFAPAADSRFASLRPRLRPQTILAAGEASRLASEAASLAAQAAIASAAEAAVAEANSDGSISPMAVSVSRVPAPRPRDMNRAVEAAVAAAVQQPSSRTPKADSSSQSHEEADEEPDTASAAPRIPTKASVAKQATYANAINLSKINLIGVYGTQSKRYALIRQANGRYKKVYVGDRFDGGTVQAITSTEVRYQKSGRLVTLAMPRS